MIKVAVVYLILFFPGQPQAVLALPMADMETCEIERKSIQAAYNDLQASRRDVPDHPRVTVIPIGKPLEIFGHCVRSGL